jgi:tight adherence protein B
MGALIGLLFAVGVLLILASTQPRASNRAMGSSRIQALIYQADLPKVTPTALITSCVAAAFVLGSLTLIVTAIPMATLLAAGLAATSPIVLLRRRARQRAAQRRASWPDAVDTLISGVRAGLSLPEAVADLGRRGPIALRGQFTEFEAEYRANGSFTRALTAVQEQLADPVADRVVAALGIAWEVGGTDLGGVLRTLSALLREDARTRGDIEARQSWTVNAARVSVAAPWLTLALLCTRPEAVAAYSSWWGAAILGAAAVTSFVAFRLMIAIGKLPQDQRWWRDSEEFVTGQAKAVAA